MLIQKCSLNTPKYFESDKTDSLITILGPWFGDDPCIYSDQAQNNAESDSG